jgi:hypothetical protein
LREDEISFDVDVELSHGFFGRSCSDWFYIWKVCGITDEDVDGLEAFSVASKAVLTAAWSPMSATKVRTLTPGCWASTSDLVVRREEEVRPRMAILVELGRLSNYMKVLIFIKWRIGGD